MKALVRFCLALSLALGMMPAQSAPGATASPRRESQSAPEPSALGPAAAPGTAEDRVVPGEWIVSLDSSITTTSRAALKRAGVGVKWVSGDRARAVVTSDTPRVGAMLALAHVKGVDWIEPVRIMYAVRAPSDPEYGSQWGLRAMNAPLAWETTTGAPTVTVAIIDTGVDLMHPEFGGRLTDGYDFVNGDAKAQDDNGHGTHVAGIAAGAMDNGIGGSGVAPNARIMPVKVLNFSGNGSNYAVGEGIRWAADHGADVINLSLAGNYSTDVSTAVAYAQAQDVLVVGAVGNSATSSLTYQYPAALPGVIGVSAVDSSLRRAMFSNYGSAVDITAPGMAINSAALGGGMVFMNGTSMATPFVAGAAAVLRSHEPSLTQAQAANRLTGTATDIGAVGWDWLYGYGIVDVARAIASTSMPDDDVPGIALNTPTTIGTVDSAVDPSDVYAVTLVAGQSIDVTLTTAPPNAFDLSLDGPDALRAGESVLTSATGDADSKHVRWIAERTGSHYIRVSAIAGAGEYTLTYAIGTPVSPDDEIPGVVVASPARGTLARGTGLDLSDVYAIDLESGDRLTATLDADSWTDFDLYLFLPDASSIMSAPVASSDLSAYPEKVTYTAKVPGTYYLLARAYSGAGDYTLSWSVEKATASPDDDIPGIPLADSPVAGALSLASDIDDVHRIELSAGQELTATLTGDYSGDFDLHLYGPEAAHIVTPDLPLVSSVGGTSSEQVTITAPATGAYYLDVRAFGGSGSYSLAWQRGGPSISVKAVTNGAENPYIHVGDPVIWTYTVTNTGDTPLLNVAVDDEMLAAVDDPAYLFGDANLDGLLDGDETWSFEATGTAVTGSYASTGTASGASPAAVVVSDTDASSYFGSSPGVQLEVATNGAKNPYIHAGDPVTWTYSVKNTGNVALSDVAVDDATLVSVDDPAYLSGDANLDDLLDTNERWVFEATGTAISGPYSSTGTASGIGPVGDGVSATGTVTYRGTTLGIHLEAKTNGAQNPFIHLGNPVTWTYTVTNTGDTPLSGVVVDDSVLAPADGPVYLSGDANLDGFLDTAETWVFRASGTAGVGPYSSTGTASGTGPMGELLNDTDATRYFGSNPGIHLETVTNGSDAPHIRAGDPVTWTYAVTNTGHVALADVGVDDAMLAPAADPNYVSGDADTDSMLDMTETWIFRASGIAVSGTYNNSGIASGFGPAVDRVTDADASSYVGDLGEVAVTLTASSSTPGYMDPVTLTAQVTDSARAIPAQGTLRIERLSGAVWLPVGSSAVTVGVATATVGLDSAATYRAVFDATATHVTGTSAPLTIRPKAKVGTPKAPRYVKRMKYFTVYGYLNPQHTAGTYPVRVQRWRKTSTGGWKRYSSLTAKASDFDSFTKYKRSIRLRYKGVWRLRAYAPDDAGHAAAWSSGYDYVEVR